MPAALVTVIMGDVLVVVAVVLTGNVIAGIRLFPVHKGENADVFVLKAPVPDVFTTKSVFAGCTTVCAVLGAGTIDGLVCVSDQNVGELAGVLFKLFACSDM